MASLNINSLLDQQSESDATTPKADRFSQDARMKESLSQASDVNLATPTLTRAKYNDSRTSSPHDDDDDDVMDLDEAHDQDDSDDEADGDENSRKRKGQRFFCTQYPPCNLSFTRSEHLARHIRKHTGERPFQCHCNRRFSRLDNLRQHAQTVHVNEEIPGDSLAATGTRFQRQIRTDRVRQTPRPRSGTFGNSGTHSRGHSRNVSTSSIGSATSGYSTVTEAKRRPPPLLMANESSRPRLGLDPPQTPPPGAYYNAPHSPGGLSTPTSATFSAMPGSPSFLPAYASPQSSHSRASSLDHHYSHRRLSVPSGLNPFQPSYSQSPGPGFSTHSSAYGSPTATHFPLSQQHYSPPGEDPRRRTWHPSTINTANYNYGRPATSGLSYSQTPDAPQPAYATNATAAAGQGGRLPGIETFDDTRERRDRGLSPPRRAPSPVYPGSTTGPRTSEYPPLDDKGQVVPRPDSWGQQTMNELRRVGEPPYGAHYHMGPPPASMGHVHFSGQEHFQPQNPGQVRRQAWNPGPATRTSPEDSSSSEGISTPGTSTVDVHPMIMPSSGFIEPQHHMMQPEASSQVSSNYCRSIQALT